MFTATFSPDYAMHGTARDASTAPSSFVSVPPVGVNAASSNINVDKCYSN